jgi:hypothetical protein
MISTDTPEFIGETLDIEAAASFSPRWYRPLYHSQHYPFHLFVILPHISLKSVIKD